MSSPDDYVAVLLTCGLVAVALQSSLRPGNPLLLLGYATVLFLYLPLGKLKHIVFFFAARADYGYRLGHRGVYPPTKMVSERLNVRRG
jgi:hypothetical protein